jgi:CheY-like chemotaxis protein
VQNLNTVLDDIAPILRRLLSEDIELVINPGSELGRVKADPAQLEQVIMNLAVNAQDAMPQGGRLTFTTANTEVDGAARRQDGVRPGRYVMLAVSDTGCGIDAEVRPHLFEPFFTTKAAHDGTGLGLAAVYETASKSDGYVTVDSEPGRGATFAICLPLVEEAGEQAQERGGPTRPMRGSETILVAEDEARLRDLVRQALQREGYTVLVARDGEEALRLAEQCAGPIHLLLTDVVMPGMSGHELAARLAPVRPEIKVVYMSGHTEDAVLRRGVSGHRIAFLQKPFTLDTLARRLREVVDGARPGVADPWLQR